MLSSAFGLIANTTRTAVRHLASKAVPAIGRLNHVAIVVPDLKKSAAVYKDVLGAKVHDPVDIPEHGVTVTFVDLPNTRIELMHPLGKDSPVAGFLAKNPSGGLHHICIETGNIKESMKTMTENKVRVLSKEPKIGAHNKPVVFLHPKDLDGVLLELEQC